MRRLNRAVNKEDSVYPQLVSKSPLIVGTRQGDAVTRGKIVRGVPSSYFSCPAAGDDVLALRLSAEDRVPKACPVDHTKRLDASLLRRIVSFVGDTPRDIVSINAVNRGWRQASLSIMDEVTLFPDVISLAEDSSQQEVRLVSFASFISSSTRGQHLRRLNLVDAQGVYALAQTFKGPQFSIRNINTLLSQTPNLSHLDIRGIAIRDFAPIGDKLLVSLHLLLPCLRSLKMGAQFMRNWPAQWWARLPYLTELTVGSRREDADWDDGSQLVLHDDFFSMLRSPVHVWSTVKLWVPITYHSFVMLICPSSSYPRLVNLTVNASGNCSLRPLDEGVHDTPKDEKKKTDKVTKKGAQLDDASVLKGSYPSLVSFTVADVMERPDFSIELMGKISQQAPHLKHFNVANTQRTAPTHVEPPATKGRKLRRAL